MGTTINTTGDLRKQLTECFIAARSGALSGDALRGVIGCANQINSSIAIEAKTRRLIVAEGGKAPAFGKMKIHST